MRFELKNSDKLKLLTAIRAVLKAGLTPADFEAEVPVSISPDELPGLPTGWEWTQRRQMWVATEVISSEQSGLLHLAGCTGIDLSIGDKAFQQFEDAPPELQQDGKKWCAICWEKAGQEPVTPYTGVR